MVTWPIITYDVCTGFFAVSCMKRAAAMNGLLDFLNFNWGG